MSDPVKKLGTQSDHAETCPRANYKRRQSCTCGHDERRAREANARRAEDRR